MAGKKKQGKDSWVADIEGYSRQIWLAGLGAYAKVGKEGVKLFESLIKDGEAAEKTAREEIDKQVDSLKTKASKTRKESVDVAQSKVEKSKDKVAGRWSGLEDAFEKRLNNAVARLGVPSRDEVKELDSKVDELTRLVEQMVSGTAPAAKVAPKAVPKATAKAADDKPAVKAPAKPRAAAKPKAPAKTAEAASNKAAPKAKAEPKAKAAPKPKAEPKPKAPRKPRAAAKPKAAAPSKSDSAADKPETGSSSAS